MSLEASSIQYGYRQQKGTLSLRGTLGVAEAHELKQTLLRAVNDSRAREFRVHLSQVDQMDLSVLQLMLAFRNACCSGGRTFTVVEMPSALQAALSQMGVAL